MKKREQCATSDHQEKAERVEVTTMILFVTHTPKSIIAMARAISEDGRSVGDMHCEYRPDEDYSKVPWDYEYLRTLGEGRIMFPDPGDMDRFPRRAAEDEWPPV